MPKRSFESSSSGRGHRGRAGYYAVALGVAWGFIYLFAQLAREWQIAIGAVLLIAAYLLFNGYRDHRTADGVDHTVD